MKRNILQEKTYKFSIRIINLYKYLSNEKKEFVISKQILRCGTSMGANLEEAIAGVSDKDFIAKLGICKKEAYETRYWLNLLNDTDFIEDKLFISLFKDLEEIIKIISSSIKTYNTKKLK